jgi:outer membrane protein OmpA-like peptidoglycan-associated protein
MIIGARLLVAAAAAALGVAAAPSLATAAEGQMAEMCNPVLDTAGDPVVSEGDKYVVHEGSFECPQPEPVAQPAPPPPPITISSDVLFAFDRSDIRPEFYPELNVIADELQQRNGTLTVIGHTDSIGTEQYNQGLSERRARSVADFLISRGIPPERIITEGRGELQPVASNQTPEGRQQNRRVEISSS